MDETNQNTTVATGLDGLVAGTHRLLPHHEFPPKPLPEMPLSSLRCSPETEARVAEMGSELRLEDLEEAIKCVDWLPANVVVVYDEAHPASAVWMELPVPRDPDDAEDAGVPW